MSPVDRLRWAIAPDQRRSMTIMLGGIGTFVLLGGAAMLIEVPRPLATLMALVMLAAWLVAMCGTVGYFRWFFRSEVEEQRRR